MRVLVVEDDAELAELTARGLRHHGLAVDLAHDGATALEKADLTDYDVVVLDRDLPTVHGDDVCVQLHRRPTPPRLLMVTAFADVDDRVDGLALGADDYLTKPFDLRELVARIHAVLRRPSRVHSTVLSAGDLRLDPQARTVTRGDVPIDLTPKEFGVLEVLLTEQPRVVSGEELLERVWDEHADPFTNAVRIVMTKLRKKLGEPAIIETSIGVGYVVRGGAR